MQIVLAFNPSKGKRQAKEAVTKLCALPQLIAVRNFPIANRQPLAGFTKAECHSRTIAHGTSLAHRDLTGRASQANVAANNVNKSGSTRGNSGLKMAINVAIPGPKVSTTAP